MESELPIADISNIEISVGSSAADIVAALISSAASIHNVDSITRAQYAQIHAALETCNKLLEKREREFAECMLRQKENLDILYRLLEMACSGVKDASSENAGYCRDLAMGLMRLIAQVNKGGPSIINVSMNL